MNKRSLFWGAAALALMAAIGYLSVLHNPANNSVKQDETIEPVATDWDDIRDRGTLKVLTRYNSATYFIQRGLEFGFEYELLKAFANEHGLNIKVELIEPEDDPIELLNSGKADILAANLIVNPRYEDRVNYTDPYDLTDLTVALPATSNAITVNHIKGKSIAIGEELRVSGIFNRRVVSGARFELNHELHDWDAESMISAVAEGEFEGAIVESRLLHAAQGYIEGVRRGPNIAERLPVAWATRTTSEELNGKLNEFIGRHFYTNHDGTLVRRSEMMNVLRSRYFFDHNQIRRNRTAAERTISYGRISEYDDIIKPTARRAGVDWRLVTAIMAEESHFNPQARSWMGAVGLMQIMPRYSQVSVEELLTPEANIAEGVRFLNKNMKRFSHLDRTNQVKMALGSYNAGIGHIRDARDLAYRSGKDPDEWENVAEALLKLMNYEYYSQARYGFVRGTETVSYVDKVLRRYDTYLNVTAIAEARLE